MYCEELVRFTDALTASTVTARDNSLADVRTALEGLTNPPIVILQEVERLHSTESLMTLSFAGTVLTFHCYIGKDAFAVKKSHLVIDGKKRDWCWNKDMSKFKFDAGVAERRTLHNFLTAVVNAL